MSKFKKVFVFLDVVMFCFWVFLTLVGFHYHDFFIAIMSLNSLIWFSLVLLVKHGSNSITNRYRKLVDELLSDSKEYLEISTTMAKEFLGKEKSYLQEIKNLEKLLSQRNLDLKAQAKGKVTEIQKIFAMIKVQVPDLIITGKDGIHTINPEYKYYKVEPKAKKPNGKSNKIK